MFAAMRPFVCSGSCRCVYSGTVAASCIAARMPLHVYSGIIAAACIAAFSCRSSENTVVYTYVCRSMSYSGVFAALCRWEQTCTCYIVVIVVHSKFEELWIITIMEM